LIKFILILLIFYFLFTMMNKPRLKGNHDHGTYNPSNDPFDILGVDESASDESIRAAYLELSKKNHPDLVAHMSQDFQKLAEEKLKKINWAYSTIRTMRGL